MPHSAHQAVGSEHRESLKSALRLTRAGDLAAATPMLAQIVTAFETSMKDEGKLYRCFASEAEFDHFVKGFKGKEQVVWVDWAYREALHTQAFIASSGKDFDHALELLQKEAEIAPYAGAPHLERGYILNQLGKHHEALKAYGRVISLRGVPSNAPDLPAAFRGMAFAFVETGELEGARKMLKAALELEPGDKRSLQELDYIESLERQRK